MISNEELRVYKVDRKELKELKASDFNDDDTVICGKYYIHIKYGNFKRPSLLTTVSTRGDLRDLCINQQPIYIRDFIGR